MFTIIFFVTVQGEWRLPSMTTPVVDPWSGEVFLQVADTKEIELQPFIDSLNSCTKSGLHNPLKYPQRYRTYGAISAKAAYLLKQPEINEFFIRLIQRVVPKSYIQAKGEVDVTQQFLENFGGDQVRFLARSFGAVGDHEGQMAAGHRYDTVCRMPVSWYKYICIYIYSICTVYRYSCHR